LHDPGRTEGIHPVGKAGDVGSIEGYSKSSQLDEVLGHRNGSLHSVELTGEDQMISPEHGSNVEKSTDLLDVPIVHAGQQKLVGALGVQAMLDDCVSAGHVVSAVMVGGLSA
jgi:hypothetical protein